MNDHHSPLDLYTIIIVFFAEAVGGSVAALTYWAQPSVPHAWLAGGAAFGAAMVWAMSVFKRPPFH